MKDYKEYDHDEIVAIADAFSAGEIVPTGMKTWYEYKNALIRYIRDGAIWENHENQDSEIVQSIIAEIQDAKAELAWVRSVPTYDLRKVCQYIDLAFDDTTSTIPSQFTLVPLMARRVLQGTTPEEEQTIRELLEESNYLDTINTVRKLTRPIAERNGKWGRMYNRKTEYSPFETATDGTQLYDGRDHYVYIQGECKEHRWGETYWVSIDCENTLYALPIIKDFKNHDFEIGKFYKIKCVDEIHFGGNKKKYVMDIQDTTEEEFMEQGFRQYALRW